MNDHDEIDAMKMVDDAIRPLEEAAQRRVLQWANSKYGISRSIAGATPVATPDQGIGQLSNTSEFKAFSELFEATAPNSEKDRTLVAAYWTQVCSGAGSFASQALNSELKDMGHGVSNITESLTRLQNEKPALVLQLKKSGSAKQARKTYRLTQEGIKRVQTMFSGINGNPDDSN